MSDYQLSALFSSEGLMRQMLPSFRSRPGQIEFACAIERALTQSRDLVIEAETGIGKSLGYLVPVLLSNKRVLISTYTKLLQDQIFYEDLEIALRVLGSSKKVAVLKGRSNYLCLYKFSQLFESPSKTLSLVMLAEVDEVKAWSMRTRTGDLSELEVLSSDLTPLITATVDECQKTRCPRFDQCALYAARKQADVADVMVVNHQLLMSRYVNPSDDLVDLIDKMDVQLIDEADQLLRLARDAKQTVFSFNWMKEMAITFGRVNADPQQHDSVLGEWQTLLGQEKRRFERAYEAVEGTSFLEPIVKAIALAQLDDLESLLTRLKRVLGPRLNRGKMLVAAYDDLAYRLDQVLTLAADIEDEAQSYWWESDARGGALFRSTVPDVDQGVMGVLTASIPKIFVSATLSVNASFEFFCQQIGYDATEAVKVPNAFAYSEQVMGYQPTQQFAVDHPDFIQALLRDLASLGVLKTLMLFTSHRALASAASQLSGSRRGNLFVQGERPLQTLVTEFKHAEHGILLGTTSFWHGVDLNGAGLECLVIDKLPFLQPDDPKLMARRRAYHLAGLDFFSDYILPDCALKLRQGFGRLIRKESDHGLFVIGDPRFWNASYAGLLQASLPQFKWTNSASEALDFMDKRS
ncbi:MAG: ATP-dependent DNA helicase [Pseudomonadales bacterium]|jgi:ATP-dependent DNA helicase DinG